jgi:signal transduction histidine kinase/CheY-like chemotaxis protein/HPt (histidine-containing phosphotransfer) domain-containing protein
MVSMIVAGLLGAAVYASPLMTSEATRSTFAVWSDVPLILACGLAFLLGSRGAQTGGVERRFWRLWVAGTSFWLLIHVMDIVGQGAAPMSPSLQLARNVVYMGLYVFAAMSLEQRPDLPRLDARISSYRVIQDSSAIVLVFGLFTYLALIPAALAPGRSEVIVSRALLFLVLDAYLLIRLAILTRQATSDWRASYGALLAAVLFWAAADASEVLARARLISDAAVSLALDVLWLPPFIALALAARLRAHRATPAPEEAGNAGFAAQPRGTILAGVMLVPAAHLLLEGIGALPAATLNAQRLCAFCVVVVLGLLAFAHERRVERDLRESTGRLARTNAELERLVDELATARDLAEAGSRAKSRFLANTSHEIRTPMNGVLGMTELLLQSSLTGPQRRIVTTLKQSAESLLAIIDDILDFSRMEAGRLDLDPVEMDAQEVAEDVAEFLATRAHAKGLLLSCLVEDALPSPLRGDPGRLRQVLLNLVGNAVKFTERGEVELRVRRLSESESGIRVAFDVRDTGIGISAAAAPRIFDEFLQADESTTRRFGGTGLGLAISRRLAALMEGSLEFESEEGKGSTFHFVARFGEVPASAPRPPAPAETRGRRLLAATAHATTAEVLRRYAERLGMSTGVAASGTEALNELRAAAARGEPMDVAVIDPELADDGAAEVARAIQENPHLRKTRLLVLSGSALEGAASALVGDRAAPLLRPVRESTFRDSIIRALRPAGHEEERAPAAGTARPFSGRVLAVEDDAVNQAVIEGLLTSWGLAVDVAADGRLALLALARERYDLVFMDCMMPGMDGFETTAEIRRLEAAAPGRRRTPVIALTASAMAGDRERCLAGGMDDYLGKPVRPADLRALLQRWLARTEPSPLPEPLDAATLEELRKLTKDGEPLLGRVLDLYCETAPATLCELRGALSQGDTATIRAIAHALKSSSANVGARYLAGLCRSLEEDLRKGDVLDPAPNVTSIEAEYRRVERAIQGLREGARP